jgi:hypothetical protein
MAVFVNYFGLFLFFLHFFQVVQSSRVVFFVNVVLDDFFKVVLEVISGNLPCFPRKRRSKAAARGFGEFSRPGLHRRLDCTF